MRTEKIVYQEGKTVLEGFYADKADLPGKKPIVLIAHDWSGRNAFAEEKARKLAELGYVGFALDMFGQGKQGETKEEKSALIQPFMQNRSLLQQRMKAGLETAKKLDNVDPQKVAAIGFCFGGLCVLDLARTGEALKGVVSFHGLLFAPDNITQPRIQAKVLALHGFDDPMVPPTQVLQFCEEMTQAKANWQLDIYGNVMHGFTNPQAHDPGFGTVYDKQADSRAWQAMTHFLAEVFNNP